jgi:hypothetical protein
MAQIPKAIPLSRNTEIELSLDTINSLVSTFTRRGVSAAKAKLKVYQEKLKKKIEEYNVINSKLEALSSIGDFYNPSQILQDIVNDPSVKDYMVNILCKNYLSSAEKTKDLNLSLFNFGFVQAVSKFYQGIFFVDIKRVESKEDKILADTIDKFNSPYPSFEVTKIGSGSTLKESKNIYFDIEVRIDLSFLGSGKELSAGVIAGREVSLGKGPKWTKGENERKQTGRKASNLWKYRLYNPARAGIPYRRKYKIKVLDANKVPVYTSVLKMERDESGRITKQYYKYEPKTILHHRKQSEKTLTNENAKLINLYWEIIKRRASEWTKSSKAPWWSLVEYGNANVGGVVVPGGSGVSEVERSILNITYSAGKSGFPTPIWMPQPFIAKTEKEISVKLKMMLTEKLESLHKSDNMQTYRFGKDNLAALQKTIDDLDRTIGEFDAAIQAVPKKPEKSQVLKLIEAFRQEMTDAFWPSIARMVGRKEADTFIKAGVAKRNLERIEYRIILNENIPKTGRIYMGRRAADKHRYYMNIRQQLGGLRAHVDEFFESLKKKDGNDILVNEIVAEVKKDLEKLKNVQKVKDTATEKIMVAKNSTDEKQVAATVQIEIEKVKAAILGNMVRPVRPGK